MVSMIESALDRCSDDWKQQNTELNKKMDLMLSLQEQRLQLDRDHLDFERKMAGLPKSKPKCNPAEAQPSTQSKVTASHKRKKGYSNFCIYVFTQHFTFGISTCHSSSMS